MPKIRPIAYASSSQPTLEGAGVHLKRAFGFGREELFDPFLLLDDFRSDRPDLYLAGFPWHPHRGIETITYMLEGTVEHQDSMGNRGVINPGEVQWMTAGSGIIHQEMPKGDGGGRMGGFQLWANLPRTNKMMPPRYREVKANTIPVVTTPQQVQVRVIAGTAEGTAGPVRDVVIEPSYFDISLPAGVTHHQLTVPGQTVVTYVIKGEAGFEAKKNPAWHGNGSLVVFGEGDTVHMETREQSARVLFFAGQPLREPIAWYGPIVMNTQEELETAFREFQRGTFIK